MASPNAYEQFTLRGVHITDNELGRGSYAVVLELKYRGLKCAGKRLHTVLNEAGIGYAAQRFLEECQLLSQARHPNIVQFLGVCFERDSQFPILVMELLPTNLTTCLDRYGIPPDEISYSILHDVSLGLAYLHGQTPSIIHRDLSANNVLLNTSMTAKISDLGVARILSLTPLQVSQMTRTPGTPAYMPPEVMVADPHYDASVDMFSFGVMMIHTLTAEWPLPKVGQTRIDPANPEGLIPVTEAERREEFLQKISRKHPLTDLIMRCLSNNQQRRPQAEELVDWIGDMTLQYPPSFENRVEMLQRISELSREKIQLEQVLASKELMLQEKDTHIQQLREERVLIKEVTESNIESIELEHSVHTQQLMLENQILRSDLEATKKVLTLKDGHFSNLKAQNKEISVEVEQQIANVNSTQREVVAKANQIALLDTEIATLRAHVAQMRVSALTKEMELSTKEAEMASMDSIVTAKDDRLKKNEAIIHSLSEQLTNARQFLAKKPQPIKVQLSHSQCSEAPVKMSKGKAIAIDDKVYYGGGKCSANECERHVYCLNLSQDVWSTLPKLPIYYFGLGKINDELVTVGGQTNTTYPKDIYVYDENSRTWKQTIPPMLTARSSPVLASLPTHLVVAGGWLMNKPINNVEIYSSHTNQWSKTNSLPYARDDSQATVCNNAVYLMGGWDGEKHCCEVLTAQIDKLISSVNQDDAETHNSAWKALRNAPSYSSFVLTMLDIVFAVGGVDSTSTNEYNPSKEIYAYSSSMDSWVFVGNLPSPMSYPATVSLSSTVFLMIGGEGDNTDLKLTNVHKITLKATV